ncbi:AGAP002259-PA [Anopheles gambiae str. PEST]|uniref:Structure-specific endonuclease subunit SLX1 homolog n=1 Tax=Anopheles gambiae TaxID=7165 RepID=A0A1S4GED8_ANOGA|nr:AGAP002259-PA [Anopheles gambiae str. PEST]
MNSVEEIEDFYGVYLLVSKSPNPKFAGRTYIGYTVDPNRRIKQHNRGEDAGGARRTSNRGPWTMVLIVHGFPNNISALRFEWAWQQPRVSRRLKQMPELQKKLRKESNFEYNFRILTEMLRMGPWNRLPLVVRWFADEFHREFEVGKKPPLHMPICFGRIKKVRRKKANKQPIEGRHTVHPSAAKQTVSNRAKNSKIAINYDFDEYDLLVMGGEKIDDAGDAAAVNRPSVPPIMPATTMPADESVVISSDSESDNGRAEGEHASQSTAQKCTICAGELMLEQEKEEEKENAERRQGDLVLRCLQSRCPLACHVECLAELVLEPGQYVPVEGDCPHCEGHFLWGDIIRKANGCSDLVDDTDNVDPVVLDEVSDEGE